MMDEPTCHEINRVVFKTLRDAGLTQPPIFIEDLLSHLDVHRDFYDLEDPTLLQRFWHKIRIGGERITKVIKKINLEALWLPDRDQIWVDKSLPVPKKEWASFHDASHRIFRWHRSFFLGDTARTLDPEFQERLENEANYGASALMFGGYIFTKEALDTDPSWEAIKLLKTRYKKSYVTTLRRYVLYSHDRPMAMMISTPTWMIKPADQEKRYRHFIFSSRFEKEFGSVNPEDILMKIDENITKKRGGNVGDFSFYLADLNGRPHEFRAQSFFNTHYILTLMWEGNR
jgi:hypothetical protein